MIKRSVNPKTDGYTPDRVLDEEIEDQIAIRGVEVADGRKFVIRSKDPYGLWEVQTRAGLVPHQLQGLYTSQRNAEEAIIRYCAQHPNQTRKPNISPLDTTKKLPKINAQASPDSN